MPHKRVAAQIITCLLGLVGDDLAFGEVEDILLGLGEQPLNRVRRLGLIPETRWQVDWY
jgi:hypothetical protein